MTDRERLLEWRPIETAPRDMVKVLVFAEGWASPIVATQLDRWDGWYSVPGKHHVKPSHWMPLPDPPKDTP